MTSPDTLEEPAGENTEAGVQARNEFLESTLNPDNGLPQAEVVLLDGTMQECSPTLPADVPHDGNAGSIYTYVDGEEMGSIVYGEDDTLPNKLIVTDSGVLVQGKGHGRRLYLEALKALPEGYGLVSHSMLSDDAVGVWNWLVQAGVAHKVEGRTYGQVGEYETVF